MTAKEFLIKELNNLYDKYKSKGIGIRYEYRIGTPTHIIEITPIWFFEGDEAYMEEERRIEKEFENNYDDTIIFISEGSLTKIKNPTLVLGYVIITSKKDDFKKELTSLLNRYSKENGSNTPDFILADYLISCLEVYNQTVNNRGEWYDEQNELQFAEIPHNEESFETIVDYLHNKGQRNFKIDVGNLSDKEIENYIKVVMKKIIVDDSKVIKSNPRFVSENFKEIKKEHKPTPPPPPEPRLYREDGSPIKPKK